MYFTVFNQYSLFVDVFNHFLHSIISSNILMFFNINPLFQIDAHVDTLTSEQASFVLNNTGLATIYNTVLQYQPSQVHNTVSLRKCDIIVTALLL